MLQEIPKKIKVRAVVVYEFEFEASSKDNPEGKPQIILWNEMAASKLEDKLSSYKKGDYLNITDFAVAWMNRDG